MSSLYLIFKQIRMATVTFKITQMFKRYLDQIQSNYWLITTFSLNLCSLCTNTLSKLNITKTLKYMCGIKQATEKLTFELPSLLR